MPPAYLHEYRYTVAPTLARQVLPVAFGAGGSTTDFENSVQASLAQASTHFQHEEFSLALDAYRQLSNLILTVAHPQLPATIIADPDFVATRDPRVLDTLVAASARTLQASAVTRTLGPSAVFPAGELVPLLDSLPLEGLFRSPAVATVDLALRKASDAVSREDWTTAQAHFATALGAIPAAATEAAGRVTHDLAVATEKAGDRQKATDLVNRAADLFRQADNPALQFQALHTQAGIFARGGNADQVVRALSSARDLQKSRAVTSVVLRTAPLEAPRVRVTPDALMTSARALGATVSSTAEFVGPASFTNPLTDPNGRLVTDAAALTNQAAVVTQPLLSGALNLDLLAPATLSIRPQSGPIQTIAVDGNLAASLHGLLSTIADTADVKLLTGWWRNPHLLLAYLPHVYFFVIPVAIGDCLAELGQLDQAEASYLGTLSYPFINQQVEIVSLWTKLANLYLLRGEAAYRSAGNDPAKFASAQAWYERVVKSDHTLDPASPLYQNPQFAAMMARVQAFLALPPGTESADNPAVICPVLQCVQRLEQIAADLNYFGFPPDYAPPFSFEYLQSQAQYLSAQAIRMDDSYVNFKSTAENEQFRQEQLDQQAALADATLELQQRNAAEAQAGAAVASASLDYASKQVTSADDALAQFLSASRDLLDLASTQAALSASTLPAYQGRPASDVASGLAGTQSMISSELEAQRLLHELESAGKYKAVTQAQLAQASQRVAVAQQGVAIAKLQQRYAAENRDFLDQREFSAGLWYGLAKFIKGISRRYLDMAIETAFLMQRAYALETGRDLARIRFDYLALGPQNLLGGAQLQADIDSFTLDYLTSTQSKKAPVKMVLSLANAFPTALYNLRRTGSCVFETTLEHLDRAFPGIYLAKVRNVALNFIGIFTPQGVVGTLRNIGASKFRSAAGDEVPLVYPADILPLSAYDAREDALFFRFKPNELRIFENNGIATAWRLDLPIDANDVDLSSLVDVQIALYFDAFFSTELEQKVRAALPASGAANSAFSMALFFPDELFFLKNQGNAVIRIDPSLFPYNQVNLKTSRVRLHMGGAEPAGGLRVHIVPKALATDLDITSDAQGLVDSKTDGSPLAPLLGRPPFDQWTITIKPEENAAFVKNGKLDLGAVADIQIFIEYSFDFRK